jgi:hypothetical protein
MVQQLTGVKHTETFEKRLSREAAQFNEGAKNLPPRRDDQELLQRRVEQAETVSNINKWLSSKICGKAC